MVEYILDLAYIYSALAYQHSSSVCYTILGPALAYLGSDLGQFKLIAGSSSATSAIGRCALLNMTAGTRLT